jgi:tetratricopeptide (TPR) repeat protein
LFALILLPALLTAGSPVKVWEEPLVIPTYVTGPPDPNPMFYFGRAYQGARGMIYPYPLYDKLTDRKENKSYKAVYLENEYLKICVLPELGGRIFMGVDKTNGYDFFYRQHVIKPALIGMLGAWISGGVEWNVPHHHRATSFLPVQYKLVENPDGSRTIWVGELELRHRMRWAIGMTLRPGKAYLETTVKIFNRTPLVQSLLYFANVATHANESYEIIFPPSTQFGVQHAKHEFIRWPIADGIYRGVDFKGVDVSKWKNHLHPISIFAWNYEDDWLAGYDHGRKAGTLHVADHHVVPGKKFWSFANGPAGKVWDKVLSDEDGPYVELMVGGYSDNQPDYSWLQPFETKVLTQYWYPFRETGGVKNATLEAAVNLEVAGGKARVGFHATEEHAGALALLAAGPKTLLEERIAIGPGKPYYREVPLPAGVDAHELRASLSAGGRELVAWRPVRLERKPMPDPVTPPPPPAQVKTNEELYLIGLRLEQFHNPALDPDPYYEEALRRDPGDSRVNTALGALYLKRGRFREAEEHLRRAVARVTRNYTSPKDCEPYYYLGVALKAQEKHDEAYDAFYKAAWSAAWTAPAYYSLAEISSLRGDYQAALQHVRRSLELNALNNRSRNLEISLLARLGQPEEAAKRRRKVAEIDPLDVRTVLRDHPSTGFENAVEYASAGLYDEAIEVLRQMDPSPMVRYYLGYFAGKLGRKQERAEQYALAAKLSPDFVFPFQLEAIAVLRDAIQANPRDARAPYYLGNLLFDHQPEEAVRLWEAARSLDPSFPIVHRNLALAYQHGQGGLEKAIASMEMAVSLNSGDPMFLFELDKMYEASGAALEKRLAVFDKYDSTVLKRDDTLSRAISLRVAAGQYDRAIELLTGRHFHIWEGGVRFGVHDSWVDAHLLRGHQRLARKDYAGALADYRAAAEYPENLETPRPLRGGRLPEVSYWIGVAHEMLGDSASAAQAWRLAAAHPLGSDEDPNPGVHNGAEMLYWQARSLEKLGEKAKASAMYASLVKMGQAAVNEKETVDFFAKFETLQSARERKARAHYIAALGYLGAGEKAAANRHFAEAKTVTGYSIPNSAPLE